MIRRLTLEGLLAEHEGAVRQAARDGVCARSSRDRVDALTPDQIRCLLVDLARRLPAAQADKGLGAVLRVTADVAIDEMRAGTAEQETIDAAVAIGRELAQSPPEGLRVAVEALSGLGGKAFVRITNPSGFHGLCAGAVPQAWLSGGEHIREHCYRDGDVDVILIESARLIEAERRAS